MVQHGVVAQTASSPGVGCTATAAMHRLNAKALDLRLTGAHPDKGVFGRPWMANSGATCRHTLDKFCSSCMSLFISC